MKVFPVAICLLTLSLVLGESIRNSFTPTGNDPKEVTFWDSKHKKIKFSSQKPKVINSTIVDWGLTIPIGYEGVSCDDGDECLDYTVAKVVVTYDGSCETIHWTTNDLQELKDCLYLKGHWYGGGEQSTEPWPMETNPRMQTAFVTADMLANPIYYGGVSESYWVSSVGIAARVEDTVPLFLSVPDTDDDGIADQMCFSSMYQKPFEAESANSPLNLTYHLCYADDIRQVYETSFPKFFPNPNGIPDEKMLTYPVWSTWAEYFTNVNDTRVLELAQAIKDQGFNNSQIEIDDNWETCYGDALFNPEKFPDPKGMVDVLNSMGYRVTLWIHPFINDDCQSYAFADQNGYFLKNESGQTQLTSWWQGRRSGLIDFTNTDALKWWTQRLQNLQSQTGIDNFKFDAGETSWMPNEYTLSLGKEYWPNGYTTAYVDAVSVFGTLLEVRVGHDTQEHPVFVRMLDKDSQWGHANGLATLIPSLLHSGLIGYPFVLPDMVGGNGYGGRPSSELFIRWAQANTFMPSIQFSMLPWEFENDVGDVTQISLDVSRIHAQFAPLIIELARNATLGEGPMMRPTWWLCPTNEDCLLADQQFLLGDDILVTPVVLEGATSLNVVFPPGTWKSSENGILFDGPSKQTISNITINSNIYFTRMA